MQGKNVKLNPEKVKLLVTLVPLRKLIVTESEWCLLETHDKAVEAIKNLTMFCYVPVLCYYDPE